MPISLECWRCDEELRACIVGVSLALRGVDGVCGAKGLETCLGDQIGLHLSRAEWAVVIFLKPTLVVPERAVSVLFSLSW